MINSWSVVSALLELMAVRPLAGTKPSDTLVESFLKDGLCDRLISYQSPEPYGNKGISWLSVLKIIEKNGFKITSSYTIDRDIKRVFIND